jgi:hypothetical protein
VQGGDGGFPVDAGEQVPPSLILVPMVMNLLVKSVRCTQLPQSVPGGVVEGDAEPVSARVSVAIS